MVADDAGGVARVVVAAAAAVVAVAVGVFAEAAVAVEEFAGVAVVGGLILDQNLGDLVEERQEASIASGYP